ncbi:Unknown protein, partial [Striga hermonthica]
YFGGQRIAVQWDDVDKLSFFELMDIYKQAGGKSSVVDIYSHKPGKTLKTGKLMKIESDKDILKLVKKYEGIYVIPLYFEDLQGPVQKMDSDGNIIASQEEIPLLEYPYTQESFIDEDNEETTEAIAEPSYMGEHADSLPRTGACAQDGQEHGMSLQFEAQQGPW